MARMHIDELEIDETLARRLLADQFPGWANLPLRRIERPLLEAEGTTHPPSRTP